MLTPWKESYDQPRQHIKSRDIISPTKVLLVKAMVFPVVRYGCESWTVKKADHWNIDAFELWYWKSAGSRRETFHSWQRSWGRGLGIRKGGIEPRECPRIFSSIYPQKIRVCLLYCFVLSPLTLLGAVPHHHLTLSVKELTYSSN